MNFKNLLRGTFIFTFWTFLFFLWFHWFLLTNWDFDIFLGYHWQYIFQQWWYGGWVIQGSYYWIFVLSLFFAIPVWLMGFFFLASINYTQLMEKLFWDWIYQKKTKKVQEQSKKIRVRKKKSYKEIRPKPLTAMMSAAQAPVASSVDQEPGFFMDASSRRASDETPHFSHRELPEDLASSSPFASAGNFPGGEQTMMVEPSIEPLHEDLEAIMKKAGTQVQKAVHLGEDLIDYVAFGQKDAYLILLDSEPGDWLADEERFNDEDPLWFSESSHRVSPLTVLRRAADRLKTTLDQEGISLTSHILLVKTKGNIINAEDMKDVWKEMNVTVARTDVGMPEELPSFTDAFPTDVEPMSEDVFASIETALGKEE